MTRPDAPTLPEAPESKRLPWHAYFLLQAKLVSSRGTCDRLKVGCVLVRDRRVVATGYNGALEGDAHCTVAGHDLDAGGHCTRAVHAEANALHQCARFGVRAEGCDAYVTHCPCWRCWCALRASGVRRVYYAEEYRPDARVLRHKAVENPLPPEHWPSDRSPLAVVHVNFGGRYANEGLPPQERTALYEELDAVGRAVADFAQLLARGERH